MFASHHQQHGDTYGARSNKCSDAYVLIGMWGSKIHNFLSLITLCMLETAEWGMAAPLFFEYLFDVADLLLNFTRDFISSPFGL